MKTEPNIGELWQVIDGRYCSYWVEYNSLGKHDSPTYTKHDVLEPNNIVFVVKVDYQRCWLSGHFNITLLANDQIGHVFNTSITWWNETFSKVST